MIVACGFRRFVGNACPQIHNPHQCIYHVYTSMFLKFRYHYIKINLITLPTKLLPMDQGNFCYPWAWTPMNENDSTVFTLYYFLLFVFRIYFFVQLRKFKHNDFHFNEKIF